MLVSQELRLTLVQVLVFLAQVESEQRTQTLAVMRTLTLTIMVPNSMERFILTGNVYIREQLEVTEITANTSKDCGFNNDTFAKKRV